MTTLATVTTATPSPEISELEQKLQTIETAAELTSEESLSTLVNYATDSDSQVRKEALNAIIRRDDSAAVDMLRKAAKKSDDSAVIIALLQTADYLAQPAFSFRNASAKTAASEPPPKPSAK